jgi:hypothetical protein
MSRRKRLVSLALGVLSVLAVAAPAAQAQATMAELGCVLSPGGVTGTAGVDDIVGDVGDPGGPLDTDTGTFDFDGTAACAGTDVGGSPAVVLPGTYTIAADGTYENLLCGTGTANGAATLNGGLTSIQASFGVRFVAGVGKMWIVVTGGTFQGGGGDGVISITNPQAAGGNCITTDMTSFPVNGGFELTLSG